MTVGTLRRVLLWTVLAAVSVFLVFQAGVESWNEEYCTPDATDCDLGVLRGLLWTGITVAVLGAVVTVVEVRLARRRRASGGWTRRR